MQTKEPVDNLVGSLTVKEMAHKLLVVVGESLQGFPLKWLTIDKGE